MLVVGIDPGTARTGYGFVRENSQGDLEVIDFGVIETPAHESQEKRLLQLYTELHTLFLLHRPESGAVEKLFFQRNVTTAIAVGQARGVVLLAMAEQAIPIGEYTPMEIKQSVVGYGGADKAQVQQMVKAILNLKVIPKPDDAADALAVAICHLHSNRFETLAGMG
jgi:crossover junction endodeoxyribonuclease RuvC